MDDALLTPEASASFLSLLTFQWISPMLTLGYARPLEATDLWKLDETQACSAIAEKIASSLVVQRLQADEYNARLSRGEVQSSFWRRTWWSLQGRRGEGEVLWREQYGRQRPSLTRAINDSVKWLFWSAGVIGCVGETAQLLEAILLKV